jgi:hypothetical protein
VPHAGAGALGTGEFITRDPKKDFIFVTIAAKIFTDPEPKKTQFAVFSFLFLFLKHNRKSLLNTCLSSRKHYNKRAGPRASDAQKNALLLYFITT